MLGAACLFHTENNGLTGFEQIVNRLQIIRTVRGNQIIRRPVKPPRRRIGQSCRHDGGRNRRARTVAFGHGKCGRGTARTADGVARRADFHICPARVCLFITDNRQAHRRIAVFRIGRGLSSQIPVADIADAFAVIQDFRTTAAL